MTLRQKQIILFRLISWVETCFAEADFNKALIRVPKSSAVNANNSLKIVSEELSFFVSG